MTASFEDKFAIQELIARYSHAIDSGNYDAWVDCFAEDGAFQSGRGERFVGRAELKKFTEQFQSLRANLPNVRHCVMNTVTDVEGDRATSSSYAQVFITGKEGVKLLFCCRADDTFVKVAG